METAEEGKLREAKLGSTAAKVRRPNLCRDSRGKGVTWDFSSIRTRRKWWFMFLPGKSVFFRARRLLQYDPALIRLRPSPETYRRPGPITLNAIPAAR